MRYRSVLFFLFFCVPVVSHAQKYAYDYNNNCSMAYLQFMSLHMQEGHNYIAAALKANPDNLAAIYVADYEDCIELLMNCDKADYELRRPNFDKRLELLEKGDHTSPWYRFCKAGLYVHWAIVNTRFGEQYKAAMNFHHSFALLEENERLYPAFEYNNVFTGLQEAVVGALPGSYKWLVSILGMKGDVKKGTAKLAAFVNTHTSEQPMYAETVLYYTFARFYLLSEQKEVWEMLNSTRFSTNDNLLNTFVKVNIALDYRKADAAIATLQAAAANAGYTRYAVFDYQMGAALLTKQDTACVQYFEQYLAKNKSDIYIKDVWQKMAFAWYVTGNMVKANYCIEQVKAKGTTRLDADKQANRFAENKTWPLRALLQARLFIDGGYNEKALAILQHIDLTTLTSPADKAEYFFRNGRVNEELTGNGGGKQYFVAALDNYRKTMAAGKDRHEQFAARAALQMGKMYEQLGMTNEAVASYNECLDMPAHDFQNSIDQQAKAGLNRVAGK